MSTINVFVETGKKKVFTGALVWPGWSRSGHDEGGALVSLFDYGPRYARVLQTGGIEFQAPEGASDFTVVERHIGGSTTDFGSPGSVLDADKAPVDRIEYDRLVSILKACWRKFDLEVDRAQGKELRKGLRGGGRDLQKMIAHMLDADKAYLGRLAWKYKIDSSQGYEAELKRMREAMLQALKASKGGEIPDKGPRGGVIWTTRYFIRRAAWHVLDHAWEIEDRIE